MLTQTDTELRQTVGVSSCELDSCNNKCSHTFVWLHNFNNNRSNIIMTKELNEKKFFIIKKAKYIGFQIYNNTSYDLTTAVKKLLALDELKDDADTSYHLQEVNFSMVDKPLKLTEDMEVKEEKLEQGEMPF
tara:strand:+ start:35 stop:430 length:396 start_codon:yes stop_codon:yes gene_type:complete